MILLFAVGFVILLILVAISVLGNQGAVSKTVYIGLEGSGKTLLMSGDAYELVHRNKNWYKKTGVMRPIISNIKFSDSFILFAKSQGVPLAEWRDIEELEHMTECDLFIDEIGAYFDARTFDQLPLTTRLWLAQADKLGVHIYAGAQDWAQIDVSYRRLVKRLYEVKKVLGTRRPSLSRPGAKHPWAIILTYKVQPLSTSDSTELKTLSIFPSVHFKGKKAVGRFNTNARIEESEPPPLKRVVRHWFDENGQIGYTKTKYY